MLRSDLFDVAPAPSCGRARLPKQIAPVEGEALVSWVGMLSAELGMAPCALCWNAFGVDAVRDPEWWRRPGDGVLQRIESWTGVSRSRLVGMTLDSWASTSDDEDADRLAASRCRVPNARHGRSRRINVCPLCLADAPRPHIQLAWMLGWTGACLRHGLALAGTCPSCGKALRLDGREGADPADLMVCSRCGAEMTSVGGLAAHPAVLDLQAALIAGKRSGTAMLPGVGALDWSTTIALADVLLAMVWERRTRKRRDYLASRRRKRLFAGIARDLGMAEGAWKRIPWTWNYGGLLVLAWMLADLEVRLPRAIATLCAPKLDGLLGRFSGFDDATKERLRIILAAAAVRQPKSSDAWQRWLRELPESAAELRERSLRERCRHRRQRLRGLAELKDSKTVTAVAKLVGVRPRSIYRWLYRGAAGGLEAALERSPGNPVLTSAQAETMGQWIASHRRHQNRRAIVARAKEAFGIELNPDAASTLLSRHGRAKPGRRRRLWGPKHGPRRRAGSTHDPAPGP